MLGRSFGLLKNDSIEEDYVSEAEMVKLSDSELIYKRLSSSLKMGIKDSSDINLFCITVDGSSHSEISLNIISEEFLKPKSKMLIVHVYNEKLDHVYNYRNKKATVLNTYANKLSKFGKNANFLIEDRIESSVHALEQVNGVASYFKANYLVSGYYGIKGPKGENNELSKGVNFLLSNSIIPTIIIKDTVLRIKKNSKGYSWLIVLDKQFNNAIRCFQAFSQLIDPENDFVFGLTLVAFNSYSTNDNFKEIFMKEIEAKGIKNYDYECVTYSKMPSAIISDKVNFGGIIFDFLVFYNNREKHKDEGNNSDVINIVKNCSCSICVYSF